jgi:hypothetical protein
MNTNATRTQRSADAGNGRQNPADGERIHQPLPPDDTKDLPELPDPAEVGEAG